MTWECLTWELNATLLKPSLLERAGRFKGGVFCIVDSVDFVLETFLTQDAGSDVAHALRALKSHVIISTLGASSLVAAPLAEMAHA